MKLKVFLLILMSVVTVMLLHTASTVHAAEKYPVDNNYDNNYVNDYANVLDDATEKKLNDTLAAFEKRTSNQIGVLTVKTTGDETIEDYTIHVADQWKFGGAQKDNGVIISFAIDDRKMRIEVGEGLEEQLTDVESAHILDDTVRPELRAGNYNAGVTNAVTGVIRAIDPTASEVGQIASSAATLTSNSNDVGTGVIIAIIIIAIIIFIIFIILANDGDGFDGGSFVAGAAIGSIIDSIGDSTGGGDSDSGSGFGGGNGGSFGGGGASSDW